MTVRQRRRRVHRPPRIPSVPLRLRLRLLRSAKDGAVGAGLVLLEGPARRLEHRAVLRLAQPVDLAELPQLLPSTGLAGAGC